MIFGGSGFKELKEEVSHYLDEKQTALIEKAYKIAEAAHKGQKRQSGEAYITHPVAAAFILAKLRMDHQSIMAALLHDVLEDTKIDKPRLTEAVSAEVAELVDGVSKLTQIEFENREQAQAENFRKMILAMVKDIRVILVKLADRLHNMRTLGSLYPKKRRRIARETLEIYAPIANRLGMRGFCLELEDLGFAALYPHRCRVLKTALKRARGNRAAVMNTLETAVKNALERQLLPPSAVIGRQKHFYSIYKKMRDRRLSFSEIMDIYGFRIVTDSIDSCYRALGVVHSLYKPVPEKFKDYIAIPKSNGYQSLHTTLFGPYGVPVEIQIRTADMDNIAENGIAAHWLYKSGETTNTAQIRASQWLKSLLEMQQNTGNSLEFIENVKIDLFPDEVYVFTPKGSILELPSGATAVDFAYSIHSDIGNTCTSVRINRRFVPLSTKLLNGQTVEIINAPDARPHPSWLNFVATGKARSNIRHFLKTQKRSESIAFGEQLLEALFSSLNLSWDTLPAAISGALLDFYHQKNKEEIFQAMGAGIILPLNVFQTLRELLAQENQNILPVRISGNEGSAVYFAQCCRPIPGDSIVGAFETDTGLSVHLEDCAFMHKKRFGPKNSLEQYLPLQWESETHGLFPLALTLEAVNQRGVLAKLTAAIAKAEADINNIYLTETDGGKHCHINLIVSVRGRKHLANVIRKLRHSSLIIHISRKKPHE